MYANETPTENGIDDEQTDDRDRRALEQYLTVLEDQGDVRGRTGEYEVVSESGSSYVVNTLLGTCDCPDAEYRGVKCKHRRRVEFATGAREVPTDAGIDVDPSLGEHVSCVSDEPDATEDVSSERAVATDGGVTVREAADDAQILEDDGSDPWEGPHTEFDKYGTPTGEHYYRCRCCGREALESIGRDAVGHRESCRFGTGR